MYMQDAAIAGADIKIAKQMYMQDAAIADIKIAKQMAAAF